MHLCFYEKVIKVEEIFIIDNGQKFSEADYLVHIFSKTQTKICDFLTPIYTAQLYQNKWQCSFKNYFTPIVGCHVRGLLAVVADEIDTKVNAGPHECQSFWWGHGYVVGLFCPLPSLTRIGLTR